MIECTTICSIDAEHLKVQVLLNLKVRSSRGWVVTQLGFEEREGPARWGSGLVSTRGRYSTLTPLLTRSMKASKEREMNLLRLDDLTNPVDLVNCAVVHDESVCMGSSSRARHAFSHFHSYRCPTLFAKTSGFPICSLPPRPAHSPPTFYPPSHFLTPISRSSTITLRNAKTPQRRQTSAWNLIRKFFARSRPAGKTIF